MRLVLLTASLVLAFATGWLAHALWAARTGPTVEERTVSLEGHLRKIAQLATVERRFNEFVTHKEVGYIDFPMFNKSVILRANARVVMGFDLEGVRVVADEGTRTLTIYDWPAPEELAFEMQTQYFDLEQGLFNGFEGKELNAVADRLERRLRERIDYAPLRAACYEQADEMLALVREQLALAGWTLAVDGWPTPSPGERAHGQAGEVIQAAERAGG